MNFLALTVICSFISLPFTVITFLKIIIESLIVQITLSCLLSPPQHKFRESRHPDCFLASNSVVWTQWVRSKIFKIN